MGILQKKVFDLFPSSFGIDLSDLSIKAVWLDRAGNEDSIASFGSVPLVPGSVMDGEIINPEAVETALRKLLAKAGPRKIRTKKVICSLPETKAFLRIISLPQMADEEVKEAIKWEIEANIPLTLAQVYYDWQILDLTFNPENEKRSV